MLKRHLILNLLFATCLINCFPGYCDSPSSASLDTLHLPGWRTDEAEALKTAQEVKKPLVIAFLGNGWCPWSEKLATEMLGNKEFVGAISERAILLHLPMTQERSHEAEAMRHKYQVYHCPQVIAYAEDGEEIGRIEYTPVSAVEYAHNLLHLITQFHAVRALIDHPQNDRDIEQLVKLYESAKYFSAPFYKEKLLEIGLANDPGSFFILEKYATLLHKYKLKNPLVQQMRKKVMERDPKNQRGVHLDLAVLEFQKLATALKSKESPDKAVAPLVQYLKTFGKKDRENTWKVELMIAQYYYSKNKTEDALKHARASFDLAPEVSKHEIADLIECFALPSA